MNEVSFNGVTLNDYFIVKSIKESILPPIVTIRKSIPGKVGTKYIRKELGEKQIEIDIEIPATSFVDRQTEIDKITTKLYTTGEKALLLRSNRTYFASLDSETKLENLVFYGATTLVFLATDPIAYGESKTITDIAGKEIINSGTYPAKGKITIEIAEAAEYLEVTLLNTGGFLYIDDDFVAEDIIVIDLENEYVTKNDISAMANLYLESNFFELPVGEFELSISSGTANLEFRERWL